MSRVLIVGAGAVGTILTAYLVSARQQVKVYVREKDRDGFEHAQNVCIDRVTGGPALITAKPALTLSLDLAEIDYLLLCVKFPQLDGVLDQLQDALSPHVTIVSTLNGVGAIRRIHERFPGHPAAQMTIMFNGQLLEPFHARITTKPQVLIGSSDSNLLKIFGDSGVKVTRSEGESAAWGKLLINLANAICGVTHTTFKDLLTDKDLRAIYAAVLTEAADTLDAAGLQYQLPMPLSANAYRILLLRGGAMPWWIARIRNGLSEGAYPSMVADLDAGRTTEVGQLNGEIVCLAQEHQRATPLNAKLVSLVQKLEKSDKKDYLTPETLRQKLGIH